jgi:hypothetical protein
LLPLSPIFIAVGFIIGIYKGIRYGTVDGDAGDADKKIDPTYQAKVNDLNNRKGEVISLVDRFGEEPFEKLLDDIAEEECEQWSREQVCCICGVVSGETEDAFLYNWGPFSRHYCERCAADAGLVSKSMAEQIKSFHEKKS